MKPVSARSPYFIEVSARIEPLGGPNRMAAFIRDAIENELARREGDREK